MILYSIIEYKYQYFNIYIIYLGSYKFKHIVYDVNIYTYSIKANKYNTRLP